MERTLDEPIGKLSLCGTPFQDVSPTVEPPLGRGQVQMLKK